MAVYVPSADRHLSIGARLYDTVVYVHGEESGYQWSISAGVHPTLETARDAIRAKGPEVDEGFGWDADAYVVEVAEWRVDGLLLGQLNDVGEHWSIGEDYEERLL